VDPQTARVEIDTAAATPAHKAAFTHSQVYTIYGSGAIFTEHAVKAEDSLPDLPRVGVSMVCAPGMERVVYYGRGPHENYRDRNTGAALGMYRTTADDMYVPYVLPQENGNRTETRWAALENQNGTGLLFRGLQPFEFSALHYTADDLFGALHTNELKRRDETIVHLDCVQAGLGGASCGPGTLPAYRVKPGVFTFSFRVFPYEGGDEGRSRLLELNN
jgi:hypothetical protein